MAEPIHMEIVIDASPHHVYTALLDSGQFAEFTGRAARIEAREGGAFSCFDGFIQGRTVELIPDARIVQAWRVAIWPEGHYSILRFALQPRGTGTLLVMDHDAFPEGTRAGLTGEEGEGGWTVQYWTPLKAYLER